MKYHVEGVFAGRPVTTYQVYADSIDSARRSAEAAGIIVIAVTPAPTDQSPGIGARGDSIDPTTRTQGRAAVLAFWGAVAGCGSALTGFLLSETLWFLPGALFAVCVAGPWALMCGLPAWRVGAVATLSVVGYVAAFTFTAVTRLEGAPVGAAVGTVIMLSPAFTTSVPGALRAAWQGIVAGVMAAFVFTAFAFVVGGWGLLFGIVVWQVAVAVALGAALKPTETA